MRANIVGTVIILSLVIWIPASCLVAYIVRISASFLLNIFCAYVSHWTRRKKKLCVNNDLLCQWIVVKVADSHVLLYFKISRNWCIIEAQLQFLTYYFVKYID